MDSQLLSKMLCKLLQEHDSVSLPGLGTFVAAEVPATFSDRGFTINPPYRRISFVSGETADNLLSEYYARVNAVSPEEASDILNSFILKEKQSLLELRSMEMPEFGKLRLTNSGTIFFVPDAELELSPEYFGLKSVSLRNRPCFPDPAEVREQSLPDIARQPEQPVQPEQPQQQEQPEQPEQPQQPEQVQQSEPIQTSRRPNAARKILIVILSIIGVCITALAVFVLLSQIAPDFMDSILFTPEELRIINY